MEGKNKLLADFANLVEDIGVPELDDNAIEELMKEQMPSDHPHVQNWPGGSYLPESVDWRQ